MFQLNKIEILFTKAFQQQKTSIPLTIEHVKLANMSKKTDTVEVSKTAKEANEGTSTSVFASSENVAIRSEEPDHDTVSKSVAETSVNCMVSDDRVAKVDRG